MATAPDRWRAEQLEAETAERQHRIWLRKRGFSPEDLTILVGDVQENALHHAMREGLEELAEYIHKQVRLALVCAVNGGRLSRKVYLPNFSPLILRTPLPGRFADQGAERVRVDTSAARLRQPTRLSS